MSQLKARCIDQVLTFENTPVITSGDVNYDSIMFDFCSAWDGFTKTAIFYRSEDEVYYQLLDEANTCLIPNEVLTEKGDVYIGVFGVNGETTLTSQVLKYKITKGAITENIKPSDPTPDIYAQIISRYNLYDERLAYFENRFNGSVGDAEKLGGHGAEYFLPSDGSKPITGNLFRINNGKGVFYNDGSVVAIGGDDDTANSRSLIVNHTSYVADDKKAFLFRSKVNGKTTNYTALHEGNYSDYVLPLTGGTINGSIHQIVNGATYTEQILGNDLRKIVDVLNADGNYLLYDTTNGKFIFQSTVDGTNTFNGTASGNLPLNGGGTVESSDTAVIALKNTSADKSYLKFRGSSGELGMIGFESSDTPTLYSSKWGTKVLLHTGNMADYVLPLTGGTVGTLKARTEGLNPLIVENAGGNNCVTYYIGSDGVLGSLGFNGKNRPAYAPPDMSAWYLLHHDGNSAKVHVGTNAPDTSSVWIDTSE